MNNIKRKFLRKIALPLALNFRFDSILLSTSKKNACIINFHGVRKTNFDSLNNRHMHVDEFEKMIMYLQKKYEIVSLNKIFQIHRENIKPSKKTIALTFDDGYLNNFEVALPVLKKFNVPATFFLITKSLTSEKYLAWPDIIDIIIKKHDGEITIEGNTFRAPFFFNKDLNLKLPQYLKTLGIKTESLVQDLYNSYRKLFEDSTIPMEVLELIDNNKIQKYVNEPLLEFGSHSHSHFNFEYLVNNQVEKEFSLSKGILEKVSGREITSIAFPDGSYTPETVESAKKIGYKNIVAVEYKFDEENRNPNLLSRFTISNSTTYESNALRLAKQFDDFGFC